jgi:serine/threonine protein kinase/predicted Zn-dependent protease
MAGFAVDALERMDKWVRRFESAWLPGGVSDWRPFLPAADHPDRLAVLTEVVRVDIELHGGTGNTPPLSEYLNRFPELRSSRKAFAEIAFEHFRATRLQAPKTSPTDYQCDYGVDTHGWEAALSNGDEPTIPATANDSTLAAPKTTHHLQRFTPAAIEAGERPGEFELQELLGCGSLANVYLASQPELSGRQVVVKISPHKTSEPQKLSRLQHSNIVPIYSAHWERGRQMICMPFLGRTTLAEVLRNGGEEPSGRHLGLRSGDPRRRELASCKLVGELAEGLAYAHQRGITHGDLKPANVLIADDGTPMLLDFNLSGEIVSNLRHPSYVGGTLPYMAPEQLHVLSGRQALDPRSDLYSLGVVLFELLTGKLPFPARLLDDPESQSRMYEDRHGEAWKGGLANCSPDMRSIVERCLAPNPAHRYQQADQLREDLELHGNHQPLRHAPRRSLRQRIRKWMTRNGRRAAIAASVTTAVVLILATLALARTRQARVERLEALTSLEQLRSRSESVRMGLGLPLLPSDIQKQLAETSRELLQDFGVDEPADIERSTELTRLLPEEQEEARFLLAELIWRLETQGGSPDADESPRVEPRAQSPSYAEAVKAYRAKDFIESERHWVVYLEQQPTDAVAWCFVGNTLWAQQRYQDAGDAFGRAAALQPRSPLPWFYRGICLMLEERFDLAEMDFTRVLQLRPDLRSALLNRAVCRKHQSRWSDAIVDLDRLLAQDATDIRGLLLRAECFAHAGESKRAEADRSRARATAPRDAEDFLARGDLLVDDDPVAAIRDYRQAIAMNSSLQDAWQNLAHVYSEVLRKHDKALELLLEMQTRFPGNRMVPAAVGVLAARMGHSKRALEALAEARGLSSSGSSHYQLASGYALLATNDPQLAEIALEELRLALVADPTWLDVVIRDHDFAALYNDPRFKAILFSSQTLSRTVEPLGDTSRDPEVPPKSKP